MQNSFINFQAIFKLYLLLLLGGASIAPAFSQTPCQSVTLGQITTTAATCPGNGTITVPAITGGYFTVEGPGITGFLQQDENVFESLNAGTFTVKLYCTGSSSPTSFSVNIASKHSTLGLTLSGTMQCANQGEITATAAGGFNQGGTGTNYQYAMWPSTVGNSDRDDNAVTYGTANQFTSLAAGTYYVRVKDNCNNYYTRSIVLAPAKPAAYVNASGSWNCASSVLSYRYTGALTPIAGGSNLSVASNPGYKYTVYQLNAGDACSATGTVLQAEKTITATADMQFSVPEAVKMVKVVTVSPCGETDSRCYTVPAKPTITLNNYISPQCNAQGGTDIRLAAYWTASSGYTLNTSGLVVSVSSSVVYNGVPFTTISSTAPYTTASQAVFTVSPNYSPYTVTVTDGCGVTTTKTVTVPATGSEPPAIIRTGSQTRQCNAEGNVNATFYLDGWIFGLGTNATKYELIDVATGTVVATKTGPLNDIRQNGITFSDVPAGRTYKIRITTASTTNCPPVSVETTTRTIAPTEGFSFSASATITKDCATGGNTVAITVPGLRLTGTNTLSYKLESADGGTFVSTTATTNNVPAGTYNYTVTLVEASCSSVSKVKTGQLTSVPWQVDPAIDKTVALTCQDLGGSPKTSGSAAIQFSGYGPFRVQYKKSTDAGYTEITGTFASSYLFTSLTSGTTYQFRIIDQCGKTAVQQATVKPLNPRIITNTVEPCVNAPYTLTGSLIDDPTATYTWTKVGDAGFVKAMREYTFSSFSASDNGTYKLSVTLLNGCIVRESMVTINSVNCGQNLPLGSIGNYVWYDVNYNGIQDAGEAGAAGVTTHLEVYVGAAGGDQSNSANWLEIDSKVTSATGYYLYNSLESGTYRVRFDSPAGYTFSTYQALGSDATNTTGTTDSNAGSDGYSGPISIASNLPEGNVGRDNLTIDAGLVAYGSIGDFVWFDANKNGLQDANENPVSGVVVNLYMKNTDGTWGAKLATRTTDANGKYLFDHLQSGIYQVEFVKPGANDFTFQNVTDGDVAKNSNADRITGKTEEIQIDASLAAGNIGRDNMTIDAGLVPAGALPVKLVSFLAKKQDQNAALLRWITTEEISGERFDIEQSVDSKSWFKIGEVKATGNSSVSISYEFIDREPSNGTNYYRLKMIDLDGTFAFSNIRDLKFSVTNDISIYPNPLTDYLYLKSNTRTPVSKMEIFNKDGRLRLTVSKVIPGQAVNIKGLNSGTYLVKIRYDNGSTENLKIVVAP